MITSRVCTVLDTPASHHNNSDRSSGTGSRCDNNTMPHLAVGMPTTARAGVSSSLSNFSTSSTQLECSMNKQPMQLPSASCSQSFNYDATSNTTTRPIDHNTSSSKGSEAQTQCGICFDSFATSSMMAALLPQQQASSSAAHGRCGHYFCQGCLRSYVQEELKVWLQPGLYLDFGLEVRI